MWEERWRKAPISITSSDLRLDLIYANVSEELPGALTREEFDANPRMANLNNQQNRYGRDYDFFHNDEVRFENLGGERLEVGALLRLGRFTWRSAYTGSRFTYAGDPDFGDNDLPGAPPHVFYSELRYRHDSGFWIAPNVDASLSSYFVDSANTTRNGSFAVVGLKAGFPVGRFDIVVDASNLTDEVYSGSVQVDNDLGRFYEPANGRSFSVGLSWSRE